MRFLDDKDRLGSLIILLFSIVYLRYALLLPTEVLGRAASFNARTLPVGLAVAAIVLSIVQFAVSHRNPREHGFVAGVRGFDWRTAALLTVSMVLYAALFEFFGFLLASTLFLLAGFTIMGERRLVRSTLTAGLISFGLWAVLTRLFNLYLDSGRLVQVLTGSGT